MTPMGWVAADMRDPLAFDYLYGIASYLLDKPGKQSEAVRVTPT
jgi:hypothetical protein